MPETKWELGVDLIESDYLFDPISFEDIILALRCNHRKEDINVETVLEEFKAIIDIRAEDTAELMKRNIHKMIAIAKGENLR